MTTMGEESIQQRITDAASDYKMGLENQGFADEYGGVDKLREELFTLVTEWEMSGSDI